MLNDNNSNNKKTTSHTHKKGIYIQRDRDTFTRQQLSDQQQRSCEQLFFFRKIKTNYPELEM